MIATNAHSLAPAFAAAATSTSASMVSPVQDRHRRLSDEEWQRYQHETSMPRIAPTSVAPPGYHEQIGAAVAGAKPSPSAAPDGDAEPPRARVACTFCRVRKLRCDGVTPCRHCERRNMDCVYAPTKTKGKATGRPTPSEQKGATRLDPETSKLPHPAGSNNSGRDRGKKRPDMSNPMDGNSVALSTSREAAKEPSKRIRLDRESSHRSTSSQSAKHSDEGSPLRSTPSSSMPGSDLAMIQNNDAPIPKEPTIEDQDEWWNQLLGTFGRSRSTSVRIVQHLLARFVQSNAVFFGLLHAPTLFEIVTGNRGHTRADPALYLAVLAVSACDMHQTRIADERTSNMRAANEASRRLATQLSEMAASYLQTSTAHGSALTPSMGQAASILALTQPDGSSQQNDLIRLAENVVRTLKLHETVSSREPLLRDSEPDSPLYWSRPLTSDSPESEVKYESIVRLCWTGISHRFRKYIAEPDEGFGDVDLPEFIQELRPMAFWQPSLLPEELPPPFFHSQDLMRRSAHLSRLTVSLAQLEKIREEDALETPSQETLDEVRGHLQSLDDLEKSFVRHRPRSDAERHNVLGRTLQMFCRMHVWVRLTIWRKYKLWNHPAEASSNDTTESSTLFQQQHHPTVEFWITIVQEMVGQMQQDLDAHVVDGTKLSTTGSEVDALARHLNCACDLAEASNRDPPMLGLVDSGLNVLKRIMANVKINEPFGDAMKVPEEAVERMGVVEARRTRFRGAVDGGDAAVDGPGKRFVDAKTGVPSVSIADESRQQTLGKTKPVGDVLTSEV
ncbi:potential fungal zinc cluster transcription factor [Pseudozyma hubeiensis SY62]|uniref:Potential fungal zinc cluster transcription factor n=1 Tax=Pseudozyma hubeiensis (strain SY62) TaxID=1305764 RepID=R9NXI8_PSEHS|nr:potential fungal zinc cluster transcription factor [Pseudozyma hubeiensis SY62]GAC93301.1 potential fungal zinc cluster transcription factor [Pseudozyma hubeiensis SY62]